MEEQEERYYHRLFHTAAHGLSDWYLRKGPVSADMSISEAHEFTNADIYFVGAVANLGAIALENTRLYDSVKKTTKHSG